MTISVLVNGAAGKMGQICVKAISADKELTLIAEGDEHDDLKQLIQKFKPEVVVDFTNADSAFKNIKIIIQEKVHPVIGTTGILKNQIEELKKECKKLKLGGIIAPNFSLGAVLMMKQAQEIAKYFPHVEIIEMHHDGKLDSPSGTAMRTAELLALTRTLTEKKPNKEVVKGARGAMYENISIHSVRLPGLVAHEQIIFGGMGETLTFRHDSIDRECFMPGVLLACKKVPTLNQLVIGLESLL